MPIILVWVLALAAGVALMDDPQWFRGASATGTLLFVVALVALILIVFSVLFPPKKARR